MFKLVRWATEQDKEIRKSRIEKHKKKSNLTFLQENKEAIIKIHQDYYYQKQDEYLVKQKEIFNNYNNSYKEKLFKFNALKLQVKSSLYNHTCVCGGNLIYNNYFNFIGCDNYKEQGFEHYKLYEPYNSNFTPDIELANFEISKQYLSEVAKKIDKSIKASDLYEFLILNNVELHRNDITRESFYIAKESSELSKKREILIGSILNKKFNRVGHQVLITYQLEKENYIRFAVPDFLVKLDNKVLLFEQKKNEDLVRDTQLSLYKSLINKLINLSLETYVIVEEGTISTNQDYTILNLNTLETYEFN